MRVLILLLALLWLPVQAWERIPEQPQEQRYVLDAANLLTDSQKDELKFAAAKAIGFDTELAVVTIVRMSDYVQHPGSIESFGEQWFNKWRLGMATEEENAGILIIVSLEDRKARIELGASWGRAWDKEADHIMQTAMVPRFKQGDYGLGILEGCNLLADMARARSERFSLKKIKSLPRRVVCSLKQLANDICYCSVFPPAITLSAAFSVLLFAGLAIFKKDHRKVFVILAIISLLVVVSKAFFVIVIIISHFSI